MTRQLCRAVAAVALAVAAGPAVADPPKPIGLTDYELAAIREAAAKSPAWFPAVSKELKGLLLESTREELVQLVLHDDGRYFRRGQSSRWLAGPETADKRDYAKLDDALDKGYFKEVLRIVIRRTVEPWRRNPVVWLPSSAEAVARADLSGQEKEGLKLMLGQVVQELPAEVRTRVLGDPAEAADPRRRVLRESFELASRAQSDKLDVIWTRTAPPASANEIRFVGGQMADLALPGDGPLPWQGMHQKDGKVVLTMPLPSRGKFLCEASSLAEAKDLAGERGLARLWGLAGEGRVHIFWDDATSDKAVKKVGVQELKKSFEQQREKPPREQP